MKWKLLWQIFWLFTKVAMFSWGGGPASLGLMQREVVSAGWLSPDEFADDIALSNALPGPTAPQASAYVGYKLAGWQGAFDSRSRDGGPGDPADVDPDHWLFQHQG